MLTQEFMREVRRLEIRTRRRVDALFAGEYHSAFKGRGIEFAEVREYEPGDDVRSIDWNATARSGRTFVKRFIEERQLSVVVSVDVSASGGFGSVSRLKSRVGAEVAAALCLAATRNNDLVGLQLFSDGVERFVPPKKGRGYVVRLMRDLLEFAPEGRQTNIDEALLELTRVLHQRSLIFVVSDFRVSDTSSLERVLRRLDRKHEVIAVRVTDPRERELPRIGLVELVDPETGERAVFDTNSAGVRRAWRERYSEQERSVDRMLRTARVDCVDVSTDRPFIHDLVRYFQVREGRR